MRTLGRFGPPVALMGLIFFLSAQPHLATDLGTIDTVLRKCAHMVEFGVLFLLWWRALGPRRAGAAVAITLAYAVSDEVHQSFVDGRHGSPWDVAIDAAGVGLAALGGVLRLSRRGSRGTPTPPGAAPHTPYRPSGASSSSR